VRFAIRASMRGPISSSSWKANTKSAQGIDALQRASQDARRWYRLTDYHWLVLYACLHVYCDLHNDGGIGSGDRVGPYEIERFDFDAIVDRLPLRAAIQVVASGQRPLELG
jgi:hypothetical protein